MFCSQCGRKIEDGAVFCSGCGARMGGGSQAAGAVVPPKSGDAPAVAVEPVRSGKTKVVVWGGG